MDGVSESAQFEFAEIDCLPIEAENVGPALDLQSLILACGNVAPGSFFHPRAAAQKAIESRDQYGQFKRLGKIIVGARCKALQNVLSASASRQHEDRHVVLSFAKLSGNIKAAFAREHYVQNQRVEWLLLLEQTRERGFAISGHFHGMA